MKHAGLFFHRRHPIVLPGSHTFTKLLVKSEHQRLLHAGPTLVTASLSRRFYIVKGRRMIRSIIHACVKCRRVASRPKPQILGQLPADRLHPGPVFNRIGVDYAGPFLIKLGPVRKPVVRKAYVAVFVCFATKAASPLGSCFGPNHCSFPCHAATIYRATRKALHHLERPRY